MLVTKARGKSGNRNLRRGGQDRQANPPKTKEQKARDAEIRKITRRLLLDKTYQDNLKERLRSGKIQPGVEVALYYYAFGKPPDSVDSRPPTPIRLVHEYAK